MAEYAPQGRVALTEQLRNPPAQAPPPQPPSSQATIFKPTPLATRARDAFAGLRPTRRAYTQIANSTAARNFRKAVAPMTGITRRRPTSVPPRLAEPEGPQGFVAAEPGYAEFNANAKPRNFRKAVAPMTGIRAKRPSQPPPPRQVQTEGPEGYVAESRGYARLNGPKVARTSQLAKVREGIAKALEERRKARPQPLRVIPEVLVLRERVHFDDDADTLYSVNFRNSYFPAEEDEENLPVAKAVFSAYFAEPNRTPLPPCAKEQARLLVACLEHRFYTLRAEVQDLQAQSPESTAVREGVEHLLLIKAWLEGMEENKAKGTCISLETGLQQTGEEEKPMDSKEVSQLLKNFAFLVLQAKNPLDGFEEAQAGVDAQEVLEMVQKVNLANPDEYVSIYGEEEIPKAFLKILTEIESEALVQQVFSDKDIDDLLDIVRKNLVGLPEPLRGEFNQKLTSQVGGGAEETHAKKVAALKEVIQLLLTKLADLTTRYETAQATIKEREPGLYENRKELEDSRATMASMAIRIGELQQGLNEAIAEKRATPNAPSETLIPLLKSIGVEDRPETLDKQVELLQERINALKAQQDARPTPVPQESREALEGLQRELAKKIAENKGLVDALTQQLNEVKRLQDEKMGLVEKLALVGASAKELQVKEAALQEAYKAKLAEKETELQGTLAGLQVEHTKELQAKSGDVQRIQTERDNLAREKEDLVAKADATEKQKGEIELAKGQLETGLARTERAKKSVIAEARKHKAALDATSAKRDELMVKLAEVDDAKQKLEEAVKAKEAAQQDATEQKQRLATAIKAEEDIRTSLGRANGVLAAMTAKAAATEKELRQLEGQRSSLNENLKRLEAEKEKADADMKKLVDQLSDAQDREVELRKKLTDLDSERKTLLAEVSSKVTELEGLKAKQAQDLLAQKAALQAERTTAEESLRREVDAAKAEGVKQREQLEASLRGVNLELTKSRTNYELLERLFEETKGKHVQAIQEKEATIRKLNEDNDALQTKLLADKDELDRMRKTILEKQLRIQQLQAQLATMTATAAEAGAATAEATKRREAVEGELAALKESLDALKKKEGEQVEKIRELEAELETAKSASGRLTDDLAEQKRQLETQTKAFVGEREAFEAKLQSAELTQREQAGAIAKQQREAESLTAQEKGAKEAAQAKEHLAAELAEKLRVANEELAVAKQRAETADLTQQGQDKDGLFTKVLELAERIKEDKDASDIFTVNSRFKDIYMRMRNLRKQVGPEAPEAPVPMSKPGPEQLCYLNYFITFFYRQFFLSGVDQEGKSAAVQTVKQLSTRVMSGLPVEKALADAFALLRSAENKMPATTQTEFPANLTAALEALPEKDELNDRLRNYFTEGFPAFATIANTPIPFPSMPDVSYPTAMAVYILAAQDYLNSVRETLSTVCPVPKTLSPAPRAAPKFPIKSLVQILEAKPSSESAGGPSEKDYARLGVDRRSTLAEVRRAYLRKAVVNHPNKGGDPKLFQLIDNSYRRIKAYLENQPLPEKLTIADYTEPEIIPDAPADPISVLAAPEVAKNLTRSAKRRAKERRRGLRNAAVGIQSVVGPENSSSTRRRKKLRQMGFPAPTTTSRAQLRASWNRLATEQVEAAQ